MFLPRVVQGADPISERQLRPIVTVPGERYFQVLTFEDLQRAAARATLAGDGLHGRMLLTYRARDRADF